MLKFSEIPTRERKKLERLLELQDEMLKLIDHMELPLKVGVLDFDWESNPFAGIFFGLYIGDDEHKHCYDLKNYIECEELEEEEV